MPEGTENQSGTEKVAETKTGTAAAPPAAEAGKAAEKADDGKGSKDAVLADLAKERDKRQALEKQFEDLTKAQEAQRDAFAKALGIKPEETSDTDKLAEQLTSMSDQFSQMQRKAALLEVAATPGNDAEGNPLPAIPKEYHHLLTATETEALQAQAKAVAELLAAKGAAGQAPGFVAGNGQGQGDGKTPTLPQQIAAAETELAKHARNSPEWRAAQEKVVALKGQQIFALHQNVK